MVRTALIVGSVVLLALLSGFALIRVLVKSDHRVSSSASGVDRVALTDGRGVVAKFSDHPQPLPVLGLKDLSGQPIDDSRWRGKVVLLNFWATWCGPCREEIPALVALQAHYADDLVVVGLSIDDRPASEVKAFIDGYGINYPVAIASPELQRAFGGISAVPSTFVVNPDGAIVQRHVGLLPTQLTEHEVRLLAGLPTAATSTLVKDTGQVLLANAAFATEIPGVDLAGMTSEQKALALQRMNVEHCTCGCNLTLAQCRINDPSCDVSLPVAQKVAVEVRSGKAPTPEAAH